MENSCLFVWETGYLLDLSIRNILANIDDISLIPCPAKNEAELIAAIQAHQPTVVLFCEGSPFANEGIFARLMAEFSPIRIIVINTHDNRVRVYQNQEVLLTKDTDMLGYLRYEQPDSRLPRR